jgi:3-oxoacyl-(acyl-carrier-protein) synthase
MERAVVITGMGMVSSAGVGWMAHVGCAGREQARPGPIATFDAGTMRIQSAFQVSRPRPQSFMLRRKDLKLMSRDARLAVQAAGLAMTDGSLAPMDSSSWPVDAEEVGVFMGVGLEPGDILELGHVVADCATTHRGIDLARLGGHSIDLIPPLSALRTLPNMALAHVSINLGLMGPSEALSPWGTAGVGALGAAIDAIEWGECEMALVGAADSDVHLGGVVTHDRLELVGELSVEVAGTEDLWGLDGFVLGEGAAFLLVESLDMARSRGARVLGRVTGVSQRSVAAADFGVFDADALATVVDSVSRGGEVVVGVGGHRSSWRLAEKAALADHAVVYPSRAFGWCVAASGLLDFCAGLADVRQSGEGGALIGAAWSPSGECAAFRCEVERH